MRTLEVGTIGAMGDNSPQVVFQSFLRIPPNDYQGESQRGKMFTEQTIKCVNKQKYLHNKLDRLHIIINIYIKSKYMV